MLNKAAAPSEEEGVSRNAAVHRSLCHLAFDPQLQRIRQYLLFCW
jgi:hypothetical protein